MKFPFYGFDLHAEVRDNQKTVNRLTPGRSYGHVVWTSEYHRLEDREIEVTSILDDTLQLEFQNGATWTSTIPLEPDDPKKNDQQLLACKPKIRLQDKITVSVVSDPPLPQIGPKIEHLAIK